ncbi:hypothetical protein LZ32DRAFT_428252 [Colletotrichum eremochloae]|nr:hypothetical protein LZ32DRAFT_428252 [Colletotrichum eremochloae]
MHLIPRDRILASFGVTAVAFPYGGISLNYSVFKLQVTSKNVPWRGSRMWGLFSRGPGG